MESEIAKRSGLSNGVMALTVFIGTSTASFAASLLPEPHPRAAMIFLPAASMAVVVPFAIRRWAIRPREIRIRNAAEAARLARRELHQERTTRTAHRELDRALDGASNEDEAMELIHQALVTQHLDRACELHLVDPIDPVMTLRIATSANARLNERSSPWDSLAARNGTTLSFESTERLDVCPHLRSRVSQPQSAIAVPLQATGCLLGVLYLFDREGTVFDVSDVTDLEDLADLVATRIAILRCASPTSTPETSDRLTGLPDRNAMQALMIGLLESRQSFSLAIADIDGFDSLNASAGRETGDRVLQTTARVARQALRPDDHVGRVGGDEFLVVFPQTTTAGATRALERLREELVLAQSHTADPSITMSIGVIGSTTGATIETLLLRAVGALDHAREQGGNRVTIAEPVPQG